MFEITIGELLADYLGASKEMNYTGSIDDGYFEDFEILGDLEISARLTHIDDGIEVYISRLCAEVESDSEVFFVDVMPFERIFRKIPDPLNPEDLDLIGRSGTIDLEHVIREEILMAIHY